jgi:hypothetical protein
MLQNLLSIFSTWANRMPAARLRIEMYSQDLRQRYAGASPYIFNRHNPSARSSLLDQLLAWSAEWATVFRPGAFYQATQLLAPPPTGFFSTLSSGYPPYAPGPPNPALALPPVGTNVAPPRPTPTPRPTLPPARTRR